MISYNTAMKTHELSVNREWLLFFGISTGLYCTHTIIPLHTPEMDILSQSNFTFTELSTGRQELFIVFMIVKLRYGLH